MEIVSIKKENRKDISNWIATLDNGSTVGTEAKTEEQARKQVEEAIEKYLIPQAEAEAKRAES